MSFIFENKVIQDYLIDVLWGQLIKLIQVVSTFLNLNKWMAKYLDIRYLTTYIVDVLSGQPVKLIQVVSTSEIHEYWLKRHCFYFFHPLCFLQGLRSLKHWRFTYEKKLTKNIRPTDILEVYITFLANLLNI